MDAVTIYIINASIEVAALFFLGMLLFFNAVLRQDKNLTQPVNYLLLEVMLLLCVQIPQWYITILNVQTGLSAWWKNVVTVLFCLDYALVYTFSVLFYYYLTSYISYCHKKQGKEYHIESWKMWIRIVLGIILITIYIISIYTGRLIAVSPNGSLFSSPLYLLLLAASSIGCIFNAVIILHDDTLGNVDTILLLGHMLVPTPLIVLDLFNETCFGYLGMAFSVAIVFLGIDLLQGERLLEQEVTLAHQQEELTRQKTQIMLSQIQPHFIYNTLATIDFYCETDPKEAQKMIQYFSRYLRTNMDSINSEELIPFKKELEHIKCYLWIETVRYDDRLQVEYDIQCDDFFIPPLAVQPLVENAVRHGVRSRREGGTVTISSWREGSTIYVSVRDNGTGFNPEEVKNDGKSHIGMNNVAQRLRSLCDAELVVDSGSDGTIVTICMEEAI